MSARDLTIRGRHVVISDESGHHIAPAAIHISGGRIRELLPFDNSTGLDVVTANDESVVMPGLVDSHVHINEPGRTDWEGFESATRAAAAGGVTTLIDMPLNSIPSTTTVSAFEEKLTVAADKCHVDVGFWGGVVPGNTDELSKLRKSGVVGFKCFLIHSGVDEFPNVTEANLRTAMPELNRLGTLLIVHAELPGPIALACHQQRMEDSSASQYQTFLNSRPREAENEAVALMIRLAQEFRTRVHIVHHSSADALPMLSAAKADGLPITA
ncbi:MAG: allantoinase, partial [Acidobacteria bacterium]